MGGKLTRHFLVGWRWHRSRTVSKKFLVFFVDKPFNEIASALKFRGDDNVEEFRMGLNIFKQSLAGESISLLSKKHKQHSEGRIDLTGFAFFDHHESGFERV